MHLDPFEKLKIACAFIDIDFTVLSPNCQVIFFPLVLSLQKWPKFDLSYCLAFILDLFLHGKLIEIIYQHRTIRTANRNETPILRY